MWVRTPSRQRPAEGLEVAELAEPGERPTELAVGAAAGAKAQAPPELAERIESIHAASRGTGIHVLGAFGPGPRLAPRLSAAPPPLDPHSLAGRPKQAMSPASGMGPLRGEFRQQHGTTLSPVMGPPGVHQ
jgi:hypothetical protein